ncbi:MAG: response regulator [Sphaerochaetaceae bacterium]
MLKVFLAEDEFLIRKSIRENINWKEEGFEYVADASDGEVAIPLIRKYQPDILITDIRMPFLEGLELSEIVKKEFPDIKIIILTGYKDFDSAKKAIGIGVTDYLLKPITTENLLKAVKRVALIIEEEREEARLLVTYRAEMAQREEIERDHFFNELLSNKPLADLLARAQVLKLDILGGVYNLLLLKMRPELESQKGREQLSDASMDIRHWEGNYLVFDRGLEGLAFLVKASDKKELEGNMQALCLKIEQKMKAYPLLSFFGGIGESVVHIGDLRQSFQIASKAFASRFFMESNQIVTSSQISIIPEVGIEKRLSLKNVNDLNWKNFEIFLTTGTEAELSSFLDAYLEKIGSENLSIRTLREYITLSAYLCCADFLEKTLALDKERTQLDSISFCCPDEQVLREQLFSLFKKTIVLRDSITSKRYAALIDKARQYIKDNAKDKKMSLNCVASYVNMSPNYFSSIFSQESGQTFIEYLTSVRMDMAKELLMCTTLRSSEVATEVGYNDSHYFNYIFKRTQNCSPKEFRTRSK